MALDPQPQHEEHCDQDSGHQTHSRLDRRRARQPTLEQVEPRLAVVDNVLELGLHQLPVVVRNQVLERVLEALFALALVAATLEATAQNGNALEGRETETLEAIPKGKKFLPLT